MEPTTTVTAAARTRFASGTAVITGAGAGIGEGLARHLATLGMHVVVADIDTAAAERVADDIVGAGGSATAHTVDVTDAAGVDALAAEIYSRFGSVELLINNAGLENAGLLWEVDPVRWRKVMSVNVDGVFHGIRAFVPRMIAAGKPSVIANLSSVAAFSVTPVQAPYTVSKHAVLSLTECLHQEIALVEAPIQVSAVLPYSIKSSIFNAARTQAPTSNAVANAVFDVMQSANVAAGLDAVAAAEHMVEAIARGDFWIFSDDAVCSAMAAARGHHLTELTNPQDPREQLTLMGVEISA
ncbi:short-chain dehydrogenase [Rhodococcus sp. 05-340-1]|uniref:SDR family NAD(P)-dependent oxidoreductase n=1 Tax=Nocardiaceae TaxID=85025 RepID=UPI00050C5730|nr:MULTISPECIES: SDR family NAD(P)-dependent oxidoreductase [Rhodococcus]OZC87718.1 short-chain dehydrogenase [Rhodococcus sp. 06-412-2C]OZC96369.1 short-chain dehydrogenase [Rhodococcus sp. 06-412-2B]OZD65353.1 short-chain dehydrogenase [Rhodococcus sp. 05-340-2]OZD74601.1 short-chain dehydrogenase [Rhodococcus sp. 05-340-1]OZD86626.1 short-chain dehydrogenase [Rhodococcus sp. 05-339-2]